MLPTIARSLLDAAPIDYIGNEYLNADETAIVVALMRSVKPRTVIEIGTQRGLTARCILAHVPTIEKYVGIDVPADHHPTLPGQRSQVPQDAGHEASLDPRFSVLIRNRGSFDLTPDDFKCDAVFIDGDHSYAAVINDSFLARSWCRSGGICIWHDFLNDEVEVTLALNQLHHSEGWPIVHVTQTWLAFMRISI